MSLGLGGGGRGGVWTDGCRLGVGTLWWCLRQCVGIGCGRCGLLDAAAAVHRVVENVHGLGARRVGAIGRRLLFEHRERNLWLGRGSSAVACRLFVECAEGRGGRRSAFFTVGARAGPTRGRVLARGRAAPPGTAHRGPATVELGLHVEVRPRHRHPGGVQLGHLWVRLGRGGPPHHVGRRPAPNPRLWWAQTRHGHRPRRRPKSRHGHRAWR
mmetsp:Transcript_30542/g.79989  ORF Transcript_30542/g.79989 Transcript_30542/m.79989 type:complete len:213 (-) Transcript_30542:1050-1688(-)